MAGTATLELAHTGSGYSEYVYRRIDQGQLQGLALCHEQVAIEYGEVKATVGVMRGGRGDSFIVATFIDDFVADHHKPAYNGTYNFTTEDILFLSVLTSFARTIRLNASIYLDREES